MEAKKYAELNLDGTKMKFVIQKSSEWQYNRSLTIKTLTNTGKAKNSVEKCQMKVSGPFTKKKVQICNKKIIKTRASKT